MTNQELKEFCIEFLCEYPTDIDSDRRHFDMAHATLRLLAENAAMRWALEWYADPKHWTIDYVEGNLGDWGNLARKALAQLPPGAGNE